MRRLSALLAVATAACLLLGLLLALGTAASPAAAQQLTGGKDQDAATTAEDAADAPPPSLWQRAGQAFVSVQSTVNRTINARLVRIKREHSVEALLAGLVIAFAYGVFHALGPGHGKAVMLSYLLSRDAGPLGAVRMGTQIALFHVVSAVVIVVVVHIVLQQAFARPVDELGFLKAASYAAITAIGIAMLLGALRARRAAAADHGHDHPHHDHHDHNDHHDGRGHGAGCAHHHHDLVAAWRTGGLLSLAVGLIPCSGAVLILVYCLANGLLLSGIMMAGSIALGMAVTLALIGILAIHARQGALAVAGRAGPRRGALSGLLGLAGPVLIILFGGVMLLGSL
ncbi:MAG: hypothetical protein U1E53_11880 [Dongiaceae bacterium]